MPGRGCRRLAQVVTVYSIVVELVHSESGQFLHGEIDAIVRSLVEIPGFELPGARGNYKSCAAKLSLRLRALVWL